VPGIITIALLPWMLLHWMNARDEAKLYALEINVFRQGEREGNVEIKPPLRNYTSFELDSNKRHNQIKLAYAEILLREQLQKNDTSVGIHFHLAEGCRYSDYVQVINLMLKNGTSDFLSYTRELWAVSRPKEKFDGQSGMHGRCVIYTCGTRAMPTAVVYHESELKYFFRTKPVVVITISFMAVLLMAFTFYYLHRG